ncbi:hypothetical protein Lal_00042555 [Lupinus albus]|nr:hypothetical protein Lal_00042555 [Lupinus albus]
MHDEHSWKPRLSERFSPEQERITWEGEILGYIGGFSPERELSRLGEKWQFWAVYTCNRLHNPGLELEEKREKRAFQEQGALRLILELEKMVNMNAENEDVKDNSSIHAIGYIVKNIFKERYLRVFNEGDDCIEELKFSRAILASTIEIVDQINDYVLSKILVDMSDANECEAFNILTPEFLNSLSIYGLPNHKIKLKVGTPIMLLRNLDQSEGLCNDTMLVVTKMANHVIAAKIMSGKNIGNVTYIPRLSMSPSQCPWLFTFIRRQFPIIVSYAMTINKSQGQSLESVRLYLPRPLFSHGQLYVVVSRVQSKKG